MKPKHILIALSAALLCGVATAQEVPSGPFAGQVSVNASLKKTLSSRDAKPGQEITATTEKAATISGTSLPRDTTLLGHVVDVTKHTKETPNGSITIVFDHAKPKKGDPMEIRSSVYKISLSENQVLGQRQDVDLGMRGSANEANATSAVREITDMEGRSTHGTESAPGSAVHVVSAVPGVALSAVASLGKSGIITSQNHDVELGAGTEMVIGVAIK